MLHDDPPLPHSPSSSATREPGQPLKQRRKSKATTSYEIEDIYDILTTFKRENVDNVELVEKLQAMTSDLKMYMHHAHISQALEVRIEHL